MTTQKTCFACGSPIVIQKGQKAECTNPNCPEGRVFYPCGFCKQFSFAVTPGRFYCVNRNCRMVGVKRVECKDCGMVARINFKGVDVCMNRSCPSNKDIVHNCFFCGNSSLLESPGLNICTKGNCPQLLEPVEVCPVCSERSMITKRKICENKKCPAYHVKMKKCPSCGKHAMIDSPGHPDHLICKHCGFSENQPKQPPQLDGMENANQTLMFTPSPGMFNKPEPAEPVMNHTLDAPVVHDHAPAKTPTPPPRQPTPVPQSPRQMTPPPQPVSQPQQDVGLEGAAASFLGQDVAPEPNAVGNQPAAFQPTMPQPKPFGQPAQPAAPFGQPTQPEPQFGQPAQPAAPFGQPTQPEPPFAQQAQPASPFGQPAQPASPFGQPAQPASPFGQQAQPEPPFGQPAQPASPFGQPAQPTSPFGQPAQPASPFGQPVEPAQSMEPNAMESDAAPGFSPQGQGWQADAPKPDSNANMPQAPAGNGADAARRPSGNWAAAGGGWGTGDANGTAPGSGFQIPSADVPVRQETSSIVEAFEFINEYILQDEERRYPIYMVIGLAGSGKTTYLTMLGEILRSGGDNYYFPYKDVNVKLIQIDEIIQDRIIAKGSRPPSRDERKVLKKRIRDLIYEYSKDFFNDSLGRLHWAGHTRPEGEDDDEINSMFLVTEITRAGRTIAKIVTLETSGEDYHSLITELKDFDPDEAATPMQRVLFDMIDISEGFVVLFSPEPENLNNNDKIFQDLFLMLKTHLEPRAHNIIYDYAREKLLKQSGEKGGLLDMASELNKQMRLEEEYKAKRESMYQDLKDRLQAIVEVIKSGRKTSHEQEVFLNEVAKMFQTINPSIYSKVMASLQEEMKTKKDEALRSFYMNLCNTSLKPENLAKMVMMKMPKEPVAKGAEDIRIPESERKGIIIDLQKKFELSPSFKLDLAANLNYKKQARYMRHLKNLALVVTKMDMYPISYPAQSYFKKLQATYKFLEDTENYLKLCGGGIRFYNASATGYSLLRDAQYYPGKKNTLTPINILEPIFDMMDLESR
ncbi:MAG: hypothetical protein ABIH86_01410 [Planctomycetota bacterium]